MKSQPHNQDRTRDVNPIDPISGDSRAEDHCDGSPMDVARELGDRLLTVDRQLRLGDNLVFENGHDPPATGTIVHPQISEPSAGLWSECGERSDGLTQFPYLVEVVDETRRYNRFAWWNKFGDVPQTAPMAKEFECEFNRPLTTIVGASLEAFNAAGYNTIAWDEPGTDFSSLDEVPGIEFRVYPRNFFVTSSIPRLEELRLLVRESQRAEIHKVLQLKGVPDRARNAYNEGEYRPSLMILFDKPQRAVGLEFGLRALDDAHPLGPTGELGPRSGPSPDGSESFPDDGVRLYAYDRAGVNLTTAGGLQLVSHGRVINPATSRITPNSVRHRIGVVHNNAEISLVELRFQDFDENGPSPGGPGSRIVEEPIVYRIWHERFPAAVVKQDQAVRGGEENPWISERLPYHCNRASVFLRGFKLQFDDGENKGIRNIKAELETDASSITTDRMIRFRPVGGLQNARNDAASTLTVYYSVVAWDDDEIAVSTASVDSVQAATAGRHAKVMTVPDPEGCVRSQTGCGDLYGGWQGFELASRYSRKSEYYCGIGRMGLTAGRFSKGNKVLGGPLSAGAKPLVVVFLPITLPGLFGGSLPALEYHPAPLFREEEQPQIWWVAWSKFQKTHAQLIRGEILTGPSVKAVHPEEINVNLPRDFGTRPPGRFFLPNLQTNAEAEAAFVGLEFFYFEESIVNEIECEVRGANFESSVVRWDTGGGIGADGRKVLFANASIGALVRKSQLGGIQLRVQDLRFEGVEGITDQDPVTYGIIKNTGNSPVNLVSMSLVNSPDASLFEFAFMWRGRIFRSNSFGAVLPIRMNPEDYLLVGGRYLPNQITGTHRVHHAEIRFQTNSRLYPEVTLNAVGTAGESRAEGAWTEPELYFGFVSPGASRERLAALQSTGSTPLTVSDFRIEPQNVGFSWRFPTAQLDPNVTAVIVRFEHPRQPIARPGEATLIAITNAGEIALPLHARPSQSGIRFGGDLPWGTD